MLRWTLATRQRRSSAMMLRPTPTLLFPAATTKKGSNNNSKSRNTSSPTTTTTTTRKTQSSSNNKKTAKLNHQAAGRRAASIRSISKIQESVTRHSSKYHAGGGVSSIGKAAAALKQKNGALRKSATKASKNTLMDKAVHQAKRNDELRAQRGHEFGRPVDYFTDLETKWLMRGCMKEHFQEHEKLMERAFGKREPMTEKNLKAAWARPLNGSGKRSIIVPDAPEVQGFKFESPMVDRSIPVTKRMELMRSVKEFNSNMDDAGFEETLNLREPTE